MPFAHVDPLNGVDSTGRGSVANPYASVQYADTDAANWADGAASAADTNIIYLWNTAADVLSATINITIATVEAHLIIEGYDAGGSITRRLPFGRGTAFAGEIDGNDAVASILANEAYVTLRKIKAHSTTSSVIQLAAGGSIENCDLYNGGSQTYLSNTFTLMRGCRVESDVFTANQYAVNIVGNVTDCELVGGDTCLRMLGSSTVVERTLMHGMDTFGILIAGDFQDVRNCTIDGTGTSTSARGIYTTSGTTEGTTIVDNLITNFSAASSIGILDTAGGCFKEIGNNHFFNNTTNKSLSQTPHQLAADVSLGADPYTDASTNDYSLNSASAAIGAALFSNPDPVNPLNAGAWQDFTCTGGGGGGENVCVSIT